MNSFALALLLGGLRGPLVMILWTSSEAQKSEKNLEDFDTKVEWIRMLQPEFDTVHIFQIWNKAYNISVQMASNANKYITILDAIEYAKDVDRERPNNINILYQIGSVYFDKLGGASEKEYYRKRVREESLPHKTDAKIKRNDPGWRPMMMDSLLDAKGMVLPDKLEPRFPRPADLPADSDWNDGSELQYLAKYQPLLLRPLAAGDRLQLLQALAGAPGGRQAAARAGLGPRDRQPARACRFACGAKRKSSAGATSSSRRSARRFLPSESTRISPPPTSR
jgi:hypothetical protein